MKVIPIFIVLYLFLSLMAEAAHFRINREVHDAKKMEYLPHSGPGQWDNYAVTNLPFRPMANLFKDLLLHLRSPLSSRGEAHITAITPNEFWDELAPAGVSIEDIHALGRTSLQNISFQIVCLGVGEAVVNKKKEQTYYLVVKSEDLLSYRREIKNKLAPDSSFDPYKYYPHITLGFSKRDLHESDKVIKDEKTCTHSISETYEIRPYQFY